jgi:hypothetical protein
MAKEFGLALGILYILKKKYAPGKTGICHDS